MLRERWGCWQGRWWNGVCGLVSSASGIIEGLAHQRFRGDGTADAGFEKTLATTVGKLQVGPEGASAAELEMGGGGKGNRGLMEALGISDGREGDDGDARATDDHAAGTRVAATGGAPHEHCDGDECDEDGDGGDPSADDSGDEEDVQHQRTDDDEKSQDDDLPRVKRGAHRGHAVDAAVRGGVGLTTFGAQSRRCDSSE